MDSELIGLYMKNVLTGKLVAYLSALADSERGSPSMLRKTSDVETPKYGEKEKKNAYYQSQRMPLDNNISVLPQTQYAIDQVVDTSTIILAMATKSFFPPFFGLFVYLASSRVEFFFKFILVGG